MADGPIQIVMNPDYFHGDRKLFGGGGRKDFYAGETDEFAAHRDQIIHSLRSIRATNRDAKRVNVLVVMRPDALAKSHQPFASLFSAKRASHVGTAGYGELIFAMSPDDLTATILFAEQAETNVAFSLDQRTGQTVPAPTVQRCEVGAIAFVREWDPVEQRGYTLDEAEDWLRSETATKMVTELFALPMHDDQMTNATRTEVERIREITSAERHLFELESGPREVRALEPSQTDQKRRSEDFNSGRFREVLYEIESSPVVKRVALEDKLPEDPIHEIERGWSSDGSEQRDDDGGREPNESWPIVGVIDGGVEETALGAAGIYVAGKSDFLAPEDVSPARLAHGTEIASLIARGSLYNRFLSADEDCRVYDLNLFPDPDRGSVYYASIYDFLDEVRGSVQRAKEAAGVRIFNLSYNLRRAPVLGVFSIVATELDKIAQNLDVIFVISAGNLPQVEVRPEWPGDAKEVSAMLANSVAEAGLAAPAESLVNVAVGAVNPDMGALESIPGAPTTYTRRSVPVPSALKPDFAAAGGGGVLPSGLTVIDPFGHPREVSGTSFAAPQVARYLATLDRHISGEVSRELLIALATHHATIPQALQAQASKLTAAARKTFLGRTIPSFVGHGVLPTVEQTLEGDPYSITLVLSDTLEPGQNIRFGFQWPQSLTSSEGKCFGTVRLTVCTNPMINPVHGAERVRVNLDCALQQANPDGTFSSQLHPTHEFFSDFRYANERTLTRTLGKWSLTKAFSRDIKRGSGKSSDWQIAIDYLTRAGEALPEAGIRFAVVLTIEDPNKQAHVFNEMRTSLLQTNASLSDLRTAARVPA